MCRGRSNPRHFCAQEEAFEVSGDEGRRSVGWSGAGGKGKMGIKRTILVDGRELAYVLTVKRVKNVNLRVKPGGEVAVSAPRGMDGCQVDGVVREKAPWIFAALARLEQAGSQPRLCDGGRVPVRGRWLTIRVSLGCPETITLEGENLWVAMGADAGETVGSQIRNWLMGLSQEELPALLESCWTIYSRVTGCQERLPPALTLRWMVSRWGSCAVREYRITLNPALLCLLPHSAAYVVFHELAHFRHPDHSPAFHALIARLLESAGLPKEAELRRDMGLNLRQLVKG